MKLKLRYPWLFLVTVIFAGYALYDFYHWIFRDGIFGNVVVNGFFAGYNFILWRALQRKRKVAWLMISVLISIAILSFVGRGIRFTIDFEHPLLKVGSVVCGVSVLSLLGYYQIIPWFRNRKQFLEKTDD